MDGLHRRSTISAGRSVRRPFAVDLPGSTCSWKPNLLRGRWTGGVRRKHRFFSLFRSRSNTNCWGSKWRSSECQENCQLLRQNNVGRVGEVISVERREIWKFARRVNKILNVWRERTCEQATSKVLAEISWTHPRIPEDGRSSPFRSIRRCSHCIRMDRGWIMHTQSEWTASRIA